MQQTTKPTITFPPNHSSWIATTLSKFHCISLMASRLSVKSGAKTAEEHYAAVQQGALEQVRSHPVTREGARGCDPA